jgi:hypothetical protein
MAEAVQPVIEKVEQEDGRDPSQRPVPESRRREYGEDAVGQEIQADLEDLGDQRHQLADDAQRQAGQGVGQLIGIALAQVAVAEFHCDEQEEYGDGVDDDGFHGA